MNQILCSTGALLGRPNKRNYRLLGDMVPLLKCDGFEFMIYSSWYDELDELIKYVKGLNLNIPVIHAQKSLGEHLSAMKVWEEDGEFREYRMTEEEDLEFLNEGLARFEQNLEVANSFGADRMVLHLWNGLVSDKNIQRNIERFGRLRDMARAAGVTLMVENVVCNTNDPLTNLELVHDEYPDIDIVYDTKMAQFHRQTMDVFNEEHRWMFENDQVKHLHVNDYDGGYMDWANLRVLPIGKGKVDFDAFFEKLSEYKYTGDFTVESTGFDLKTGLIDYNMLNDCFSQLRRYIS